MRKTRGVTLVEMMVAMTVFLVIIAAAMSFLSSQSRLFTKGSEVVGTLQNIAYGTDNLTTDMRVAGSNTTGGQPQMVYASANAIVFNGDYASSVKEEGPVFYDPDAPDGTTLALPVSRQIALPGGGPTYPSRNYFDGSGQISRAETISLYFELDSDTPRTDDYILRRRANDAAPEVVTRNILADSTGLPFYQYERLQPAVGTAAATSVAVPSSALPLFHSQPEHGTTTDTLLIDKLRAVKVSYRITNGLTGTKEKKQAVRFSIPLSNVGVTTLKVCGSAPLFGVPVTALPGNELSTGDPLILLQWNAALDESTGEKDVVNYVIFRRLAGVTEWGDPYASVPALDRPSYIWTDTDVNTASTYEYLLQAQDCSPRLSEAVLSVAVTAPTAIPPDTTGLGGGGTPSDSNCVSVGHGKKICTAAP